MLIIMVFFPLAGGGDRRGRGGSAARPLQQDAARGQGHRHRGPRQPSALRGIRQGILFTYCTVIYGGFLFLCLAAILLCLAVNTGYMLGGRYFYAWRA
jgi:hypothetical protein